MDNIDKKNCLEMDDKYFGFIKYLEDFINDIKRYSSEKVSKVSKVNSVTSSKLENISKYCGLILGKLDNLDPAKIILRVYSTLSEKDKYIKNKNNPYFHDNSLFSEPLIILPEIDLSTVFNVVGDHKKKKIFVYLAVLLEKSDLVINFAEYLNGEIEESKNLLKNDLANDMENMTLTEKNNAKIEKMDIFKGYGTDNADVSINDFVSPNGEGYKEHIMKPGLISAMNMLGTDKVNGLKEMTDSLKNVKKEDISKMTDSIKSLLTDIDCDPNMKKTMFSVFDSVSENLGNVDLQNGDVDIMDKFMDISKNVALKMKNENMKFDKNDLLKMANNIGQKLTDEDGENIMNKMPFNPMEIMGDLTSGKVSQEEYLQKCKPMFDAFNFDPSKMADDIFNKDQ